MYSGTRRKSERSARSRSRVSSVPSTLSRRQKSVSRRRRILSVTRDDLKKLVDAAVRRREQQRSSSRRRTFRMRARRFTDGRKDIGVFGYEHDSPASVWLATDGESDVEPACLLACVEQLHGLTLSPTIEAAWTFQTRVLNDDVCNMLISAVDAAWKFTCATATLADSGVDAATMHTDFKLPMSASVLESTIGFSAYDTLQTLLDAEPDDVVVRRTQATGQWINFHVDDARVTVQIPLRSDEPGSGGRLVFVGDDGTPVPRPRQAGVPLVHTGEFVHGVTRYGTSGDALCNNVRYGLFLRKL